MISRWSIFVYKIFIVTLLISSIVNIFHKPNISNKHKSLSVKDCVSNSSPLSKSIKVKGINNKTFNNYKITNCTTYLAEAQILLILEIPLQPSWSILDWENFSKSKCPINYTNATYPIGEKSNKFVCWLTFNP